MYGGRAIDSFDRRILTTYMDEYLGDFIFDTFQPFHFYRNDEVDYKIPTGQLKDDFVGKKCSSFSLSLVLKTPPALGLAFCFPYIRHVTNISYPLRLDPRDFLPLATVAIPMKLYAAVSPSLFSV